MFIIILFFIYGLALGSFANVVIYRLHEEKSIISRGSRCQKCDKKISWRDNVPVLGFVLLKGKCRNCMAKISWQYPLVEIATGAVFALIGYFYTIGSIGTLLDAILYALVAVCFVIIFVYDLKYMEIPMSVMWSAIGLLLIILIISQVQDKSVSSYSNWMQIKIVSHLVSALVAFVFFFGLSFVSNETWMGYGDAFVAIAIGLLLGPMGTFLALMCAFCIGAIVGIVLVLLGGKTMKTAIPFGPFLLLGLFIVFVIEHLYPGFLDYFLLF